MKTLAQIRAANALQSAPTVQLELDRSGQGDALSGFPMLILIVGLLAALAFSVERKRNDHGQIVPKHAAHLAIAVALATHLRHERIAICSATDANDLLSRLARDQTASQLRRATAEAIAFLGYLKRFVA